MQVKYTAQMSTVVSLICLGPSFQKMTHHFLLKGSLRPTNLEKNLKPCYRTSALRRITGIKLHTISLCSLLHTLLKDKCMCLHCCRTSEKWQLKTLFLAIFDPHPSNVKSVFDCRLSDVSVGFRLFYDCVLIWRIFSHLEGPY